MVLVIPKKEDDVGRMHSICEENNLILQLAKTNEEERKCGGFRGQEIQNWWFVRNLFLNSKDLCTLAQ